MESSGLPPDPARPRLALVRPQDVPPAPADTTDATNVNESTVAPPLLPRIAAGDELAVRECVARYGSLVWALARRWSPDLRDVEDVVQDVFVDLWRSAHRFDPARATEAGWVAMVTRRRLIDRMRRRQRAVELEPLPDDFDQADDRETPDLDRQARVEQAHTVLQALPPVQRTMLELSLLHGRTHDEIARETGTPLGTVKSHIRRGLQRARTLLHASAGTPADTTGIARTRRSDTEDLS
jgi:RNA polymerase sigma-70 factor (ECF subfamily)